MPPLTLLPQTAFGALMAVVAVAVMYALRIGGALQASLRAAFAQTYEFPLGSREYTWLSKWLATQPAVQRSSAAALQLRGPAQGGYSPYSPGYSSYGRGGESESDEEQELTADGAARSALLLQAPGGDARRLRASAVPATWMLLRYRGATVLLTRGGGGGGGGGGGAALLQPAVDYHPSYTPPAPPEPPAATPSLQLTVLRHEGGEALVGALLDEARTAHAAAQRPQLRTLLPRGSSWQDSRGRPVAARELVLPPPAAGERSLMERLLADVARFHDSERWYTQRGIPYHRGYLLHGPPGCGKTMAAHAVATELRCTLALLDLGARGMDDDVMAALFEKLPPRCVVLIEHVDRMFDAARRRVAAPPAGGDGADVWGAGAGGAARGITFQGLLNVLDGVNSRPGCCVFYTARAHPGDLDAALVRPGRCDYLVELPRAQPAAGAALFRSFFARHPHHELPPAALDAAVAAFRAALARRDAAHAAARPAPGAPHPYSLRDVVSFVATRSPRQAVDEAALLGLDALEASLQQQPSPAAADDVYDGDAW